MDKHEMFSQRNLEIEINGYEMWQDFDRIAKFLKSEHHAVLIKRADGPDARICEFRIDGVLVMLGFDDMIGNSLRAENKESFEKVKLLAKEIETNSRLAEEKIKDLNSFWFRLKAKFLIF